eukprot:TRINITY_DN5946_c0_g1_i3.p1 TRINITY_DN5946_c0_g1~~TRINITY_DN5946_c0_g1_i3.p1  ORF type:complete len:606 (+),score=196.05 TRINITY_DN5946_c0_g1_i3:62-1819(+)
MGAKHRRWAQRPRCKTPVPHAAAARRFRWADQPPPARATADTEGVPDELRCEGGGEAAVMSLFDQLHPRELPRTRLAAASAIADAMEAQEGERTELWVALERRSGWVRDVLRIIDEKGCSAALRSQALSMCRFAPPRELVELGGLPAMLQAVGDSSEDVSVQAGRAVSTLARNRRTRLACEDAGVHIRVVEVARKFAEQPGVVLPLQHALYTLADLRLGTGSAQQCGMVPLLCRLLQEQRRCVYIRIAALWALSSVGVGSALAQLLLDCGALGAAAVFLKQRLEGGDHGLFTAGPSASLISSLRDVDGMDAMMDADVLSFLGAAAQAAAPIDANSFGRSVCASVAGLVQRMVAAGQGYVGAALDYGLLQCCVRTLTDSAALGRAHWYPYASEALACVLACASDSQLREIGRQGGHVGCCAGMDSCGDGDVRASLVTGLQRLLAAGDRHVHLRHGGAELSDASTPLADTGICAESLVEFVSADVGFEPLQEEEAGPGLPVFVLSPAGDRAVFHVPADGTVGDLVRLAATRFSAQGCRVTVPAAERNEYASDMLTEGDAVRRLRDVASRVPRTAELVAELLQTYFAD